MSLPISKEDLRLFEEQLNGPVVQPAYVPPPEPVPMQVPGVVVDERPKYMGAHADAPIPTGIAGLGGMPPLGTPAGNLTVGPIETTQDNRTSAKPPLAVADPVRDFALALKANPGVPKSEPDPSPGFGAPQVHSAGYDFSRYPLPPEQRHREMRDIQNERFAMGHYMDAEAARAEQLAKTMAFQTAASEEAHAINQRREIERRDYAQNKLKEAERYADEAASGKVDPNHYADNASTLSKVFMLIGAGLGGFNAARNGTPNHNLAAIDDAIKTDIDAQKFNIETKQKGAQQKMNAYHALLAGGNDERQAELQLEMAQWRIAKQQVENTLASTESPIVKTRAELMNNEMDKKLTGLLRQYYEIAHVNSYVGGAGAGKGGEGHLVPGIGLVYDLKQARKLQGKVAAAQSIKQLLGRMKVLTSNGTRSIADTAELETLKTKLPPLMARFEGNDTGRFSTAHEELVQKGIGNPESFWNRFYSSGDEKKNDTFVRYIDEDLANTARALAAQQGVRGYGQTKRGDFAPVDMGLPEDYHGGKVGKEGPELEDAPDDEEK